MASEKIRYRTKRMLADALQQVMRTKHLDQITIADIVKECGVSRKAFYYHFEDIYDLTRWILEEEWKEIGETTGEDLQTSLQELISYVEENRLFCLSILNSSQSFRIENLFEQRITQAIEDRLKAQEAYGSGSEKERTLFAECSCICISAMFSKWLQGEIDCDRDELIFYIKGTITPIGHIL